MEFTNFSEKYNKVSGKIYVVEEECRPDGGVYEAELKHDNINESTLSVYTGRKLTGEKIASYVLSTPSMTPWKRVIRIYTAEPLVYVTYETEGDTVEAEDINRVQDAILSTQEAINSEGERALKAEQDLEDALETEASRAVSRENELDASIQAEGARAKAEEDRISLAMSAEQIRAEAAENLLKEGLAEEQQRAALRENVIEGSISSELQRAQQAEQALSADIAAEETRAREAESSLSQTINTNKPLWDDKYTKNEVDNKFSVLESNIDWKESVNTFADISTAYPIPQDGWTVNVKDTDYTYRWNGSSWIAISANSIPKATSSVDGLLSKGDKVLYDDAVAKKHNHSNQSILDAITQAIVNGWNSAVTHISDAVKHITAAERTNWTDAYNKRHDHGNKTVLDAITQAILDKWNTVSNKVDKETGKGLSSNDYTTAEKTKLAGIAAGAEANMQADWNVSDMASDAYIKNKPTSMPASDVAAWAKSPSKPTYGWTEIGSRPTKVSQFTNDSGFITSADIDTSQNHTHGNKIVLDKITLALLDTWNTVANKVDKETGKGLSTNDYSTAEKTKLSGIASGANNYVHPATHPASVIAQDTNNRFTKDTEKAAWNNKLSTTGDASNTTNTFSQAANLENIATGEKQSVTFGKIMKAIAEFFNHKALATSASIVGHVKLGTIAGTACQGNDSRLSDKREPMWHASDSYIYGVGGSGIYGHVKISDVYKTKVADPNGGIGASQKAVSDFYNEYNGFLDLYNEQMDAINNSLAIFVQEVGVLGNAIPPANYWGTHTITLKKSVNISRSYAFVSIAVANANLSASCELINANTLMITITNTADVYQQCSVNYCVISTAI